MTRIFTGLFFMLFFGFSSFSQVDPPEDFFPHAMGEHFTPHHLLVSYYRQVADQSPLVKIIDYGKTNQDRPLILAVVTSENNHRRLDEIRKNNLKLAGIEEGSIDTALSKVFVWLSFSVHGNEAAGSESAPYVLYDLVDPNNAETKEWLENTVVILDPSINPDGYSRYTHWIRNVAADNPNTDINDVEHQEPWPGGRVNHYLFDLNRDWAWQTQVESRQRMQVYNQWLPHVHADLHEMGYQSPYYFAPAARPYHDYISQWQRDFQTVIGKNHAKYFDKNGWLYFTKEVFDLFYPSYGDTYPTFSGAIGMTYEQGGGSRGARGIDLQNGEKLTLKDRIAHHKTTALSTIEVSNDHRQRVLEEFYRFYKETAAIPKGEYTTFLIKRDITGNRLSALCDLLDRQGIKYGTVDQPRTVNGFNYLERNEGTMEAIPGDLIVSAFQPKSVLAQVLLNPDHDLEDSLTYDITAWSLPYAYGLKAMASKQRIQPDGPLKIDNRHGALPSSYAYALPWTDMDQVRFAAQLLKKDISMRYTPRAITMDSSVYPAGTLIISRADNQRHSELTDVINTHVADHGGYLIPLQTGFADSGPDLGSNRIDLVAKPKVLTLMGEGVSTYSFGQIKWYFDRIIQYPHTMIDLDQLRRTELGDYNVLILPDGFYRLDKSILDRLSTWVRDGGKVIVMGRATRNFVDAEGFGLKKYASDEEKQADQKATAEEELESRYDQYSDRERNFVKQNVPGAIFGLDADTSHPLAFGLDRRYYSLRTSSLHYPLAKDVHNVIVHPKKDGPVIGFAGSKIRKDLNDSLVFGVEDKGRGKVIYMVDNPLFRGFWYNGLFLFGNALFMIN